MGVLLLFFSLTNRRRRQREIDVILNDVGERKINIIKEVRRATDCGLKEAKDLVEGTLPVRVVYGVGPDEAAVVARTFEENGAAVEVVETNWPTIIADLKAQITVERAATAQLRGELRNAEIETSSAWANRRWLETQAEHEREERLRTAERLAQTSTEHLNALSRIDDLREQLKQANAQIAYFMRLTERILHT